MPTICWIHLGFPAGADAPLPDRPVAGMTAIEVASEVCSLVRDKGANHADVRDDDVNRSVFFKVVDSNPSGKKVLRPSHKETSSSDFAITVFRIRGGMDTQGGVLGADAGNSTTIDLSKLDMLELMKCLVTWGSAAVTQSSPALPAGARQALESLDQMSPLGPQPVQGSDGVYRWVPHGHAHCGQAIVEHLFKQQAFASTGEFVLVTSLPDTNDDVLSVLLRSGVVASRQTEFADTEIALQTGGLIFEPSINVLEPCFTLGQPVRSLKQASKLELLAQLVREGWATCDLSMAPLVPNGARVVSLNMISRSKKYLEVLLDSAAVFHRKAPRIHHHMPEMYYVCLQVMRDLSGLHALPNLLQMGNVDFKAVLANNGVLPAAAPLAIADGVMRADDDPPEEIDPDLVDAFGDGDRAAPAAEEAVPLAAFVGDVLAGVDARAVAQSIYLNGCTVRFDNWSHSSGILRLYTTCKEPTHHACHRYAQVNRFPTTREVAAYLVGWWEMGASRSRQEHQNSHCVPSAARMA